MKMMSYQKLIKSNLFVKELNEFNEKSNKKTRQIRAKCFKSLGEIRYQTKHNGFINVTRYVFFN